MSGSSKFDVSKVHLIGLIPINFSVYNDKENPLSSDSIENFEYNFETDVAYNTEEKLFKIKIEAKIEVEADEKWAGNAGADIEYDFIFCVDNFEDFISNNKKNETVIDDLIVVTLTGISFSTMRGLVIARSGGTIIENSIFPVIDPKDLL